MPKIVMHSWPHLEKKSGSPRVRALPMPATALLGAAMQSPAHADTLLATWPVFGMSESTASQVSSMVRKPFSVQNN